MQGTCAVRLLGGFAVEVNGRPVAADAWRHRRGADLVKLLALAPGHRLHREQVTAALWPELDSDAASANLRKAIHFARRALSSPGAIAAGPDMLELWPGGTLDVDAERLEAVARRALAGGTDEPHLTELLGDELLPEDRYAEWTDSRRESLRALALEVLRKLRRWNRILEIDRTDEQAHRALMRGHLESGDRQAAIRQFQRLREALRADLGVGPEEETVALFERALAGKGSEPPSLAEGVQTLIARGLLAWNRRDLGAAERLAEDARSVAREHHLARELGEACALLGMAAFARGNWRERFRGDFDEAIRLPARESGFVFDAHLCLAETAMESTQSGAVAAQARELLPAAERAGSLQGQAVANLLIGECGLFAGQLEEARHFLKDAEQLFRRAGADSGRAFALVRLAENAIALGNAQDARDLLAQAQVLAERSELAPHLVPRVLAARLLAAPPDRRMPTLTEAERGLRAEESCGPCSIGYYVVATIAWAKEGELARAHRCLADAERCAGLWQGAPWRAATWEARAIVRLAEGDRGQAGALLHEAAELFATCGRTLDERRCREQAAGLLSV